MTTLERCLEFLDRTGVWYSHSKHPLGFTAVEVAFAEQLSPHKVAKTVVYASAQGYGMAVLPADCLIDMRTLGNFLNDAAIHLATEQELGQLFPDCELGAMPPFGNLFNLPVIVDTGISEQEFIAFNAGTHRDMVHMSYGDYARLENPAIGKFAFTAVEQSLK